MPIISMKEVGGMAIVGRITRANRAIRGALNPERKKAAKYLLDQIRKRFDREVSPEGVKWKRSKRAMGEGPRRLKAGVGRTLFITGTLRDSIAMREASASSWEVYGDKTIAPYAEVHHTGFTPPGKGQRYIRPRPYLGASLEDKEHILEIFERRIDELLNRD